MSTQQEANITNNNTNNTNNITYFVNSDGVNIGNDGAVVVNNQLNEKFEDLKLEVEDGLNSLTARVNQHDTDIEGIRIKATDDVVNMRGDLKQLTERMVTEIEDLRHRDRINSKENEALRRRDRIKSKEIENLKREVRNQKKVQVPVPDLSTQRLRALGFRRWEKANSTDMYTSTFTLKRASEYKKSREANPTDMDTSTLTRKRFSDRYGTPKRDAYTTSVCPALLY